MKTGSKRITGNILLLTACLMPVVSISAETLNVAVASNFAYTLKLLSADFKKRTGHQLRISSASTGKLYAQIIHGAPFDIFLAADEQRPNLLLKENKAERSTDIVYAKGQIVLISNIKPTKINDSDVVCKDILASTELKRLSIANPKTAPYGLAAKQVMQKLNLWQRLQPRLVKGENIAQTLQFVSTQNAEAGFVAKSMLAMNKNIGYACLWDIPTKMYTPIKQKMVVLKKARDKSSAQDFLKYIQSNKAKEIIRSAGYDVL